jgi:hypothetical protein
MKPMPKKPSIIIAQVETSGTAEMVTESIALEWSSGSTVPVKTRFVAVAPVK